LPGRGAVPDIRQTRRSGEKASTTLIASFHVREERARAGDDHADQDQAGQSQDEELRDKKYRECCFPDDFATGNPCSIRISVAKSSLPDQHPKKQKYCQGFA
jgi:hypothetical protein